MGVPRSIEPFMATAMSRAALDVSTSRVHLWTLGPDEASNELRLEAVIAGYQRATAVSACELEAAGRSVPTAGDLLVVRDAKLRPRAVVSVVESRMLAFGDVDELFAADTGEGDLSLRYWREVHRPVFERSARLHGCMTGESMPIVAIRFELVYPSQLGA